MFGEKYRMNMPMTSSVYNTSEKASIFFLRLSLVYSDVFSESLILLRRVSSGLKRERYPSFRPLNENQRHKVLVFNHHGLYDHLQEMAAVLLILLMKISLTVEAAVRKKRSVLKINRIA